MRLPGTINIVNNDLPTAQFLAHYRILKLKQRAAKKEALTNKFKNGALVGKATTGSKNNNNNNNNNTGKDSGKAKDGRDDNDAKADDGFNEVQDAKLIELKVKDTSWKAIATELGKEASQVKQRFNLIKPTDFDRRHNEALAAKKEERQQQQSGEAGDGGGNKNEQSHGGAGNDNGGGKKVKKNKGKGAAWRDEEADDEDGDDWWEQPDRNWSKEEVSGLRCRDELPITDLN
jgi:hypothetical protein